MSGLTIKLNLWDIKAMPQSSSKSLSDIDDALKLMAQSFGVPSGLMGGIVRARSKWEVDSLKTFKSEYLQDYYYTDSTSKHFIERDTIERLKSFDIPRSEENDKVYFWKRHALFKHLADEKDSQGNDIYVYSFVDLYMWNVGNKNLIENPETYLPWIKFLPNGLFEEVAANWFEFSGTEEDLEGIKILTN